MKPLEFRRFTHLFLERKQMNCSSLPTATIATIATVSAPVRTLPMKVSLKGAVSIYGLGRFPVTLYSSQMKALLANKEAIIKFMEDNTATLTTKA